MNIRHVLFGVAAITLTAAPALAAPPTPTATTAPPAAAAPAKPVATKLTVMRRSTGARSKS